MLPLLNWLPADRVERLLDGVWLKRASSVTNWLFVAGATEADRAAALGPLGALLPLVYAAGVGPFEARAGIVGGTLDIDGLRALAALRGQWLLPSS